ncbi:MAG: hypothetical protein GY940_41340, partial [bacterium]|nr:hypothetical protein [bacterium]
RKRLLFSAFSNQGDGIPFERRVQDRGSPDELHIFSIGSEQANVLNVNLRVDSFYSSFSLQPLLQWFRLKMVTHVVDVLSDHLPVIKTMEVKPPSKKINVDEEVTIFIHPGKQPHRDPLLADFFFNGDSLRLVSESAPGEGKKSKKSPGDFSFTFKGKIPGDTTVRVALVNKKKLLCSEPAEVTITVT